MTEHGDSHGRRPDPHEHGHGDGGHDHGPPVWRGLTRWLYPILYRNPASNRLVVELAALTADDRVLDIGCGPGAAVRAAAPLVEEAVGADPSDRMLRMARRRSRALSNVRYHQAPAHHLPFGDDVFTAVWTVHSMHHWGDEEAGVSEVLRVLASGGRFLVVEQLDPGKPWGIDEAGIDRITSMTQDAGFADVQWTKHRVGRADEVVIEGRA